MLTHEARATNVLLEWLLQPGGDDAAPTNDEARAAAEELANQAYRRLGAGINGAVVVEAWAELELPGLPGDAR